MRRHAVRALVATVVALAATAAPLHAGDDTRCLADALTAIGWRVVPSSNTALHVRRGAPCERADLAHARAAGDLTLWLPPEPAPDVRDALAALLHDPATHCAFSLRLGEATRHATAKLAGNPRYRFSALQAGWIAFGGDADARWRSTASFGRAFVPSASPAAAVRAFYDQPVRSECGVGRQIAQYAGFLELFGDAAFDRAFADDGIVVGTFRQLQRSNSVLLGDASGPLARDGKAVRTASQGRAAFLARPGGLIAVDRDALVDLNNQAQNFVVVDVTAGAAAALRRHGGFAHYDAVNREVQRLALEIRDQGHRWFERLVFDRDPLLRSRLGDDERTVLARIDALMDDPFYAGFVVYVHPQRVRPIGFHVARMLDRNPGTPYALELTNHNLHGGILRRFVDDRLAACRGTARR